MIQEAERSIWIVTPYFIPDDVLLRSLIVKARAGREVTLVVPARSNHPVADLARRSYIRELRRAGARVLHLRAGCSTRRRSSSTTGWRSSALRTSTCGACSSISR